MKKIISVLAMALLVIGAAQAQNQVRKMFIHKNNGQIVKIKAADIQEVTFEMDIDLPDVPTTIEEAKAMIVGYWRDCTPLDGGEDYESVYFVITEDLKALSCVKVKDSVTDGYLAPYAGKYVAYEIGEITFPNEEDPTTFYLGDEWTTGTNLQMDRFYYHQSDYYQYFCIRVEPFEYILLDFGLMKK